MLVLSRKADQAIVLPELGIRILIVGIKSGSVKIGIEADSRHTILREELIPESENAARPKSCSIAHVDLADTSASGVG